MNEVPNVNLFIGYVNDITGLAENDEYMKMYGEKRKFYSSDNSNDYLKYVQTGSKEVVDYIEYSGNSEKSHGAFNQFGLMNEKQMKNLRKELRSTKSVIWHGVISFTEKFGNEFCGSYEKAYEMMKREMPKFLSSCNLNPNNVIWFAGLHENTDNKHIHFSFFEKSPERYRKGKEELCYSDGLLPIQSINRAKVSMELTLTSIPKDISNNRNLLTEDMKNKLETGAYMKTLNSLIIILPREGRMQYDSENMKSYRPYIDLITNTIISHNEDLSKKFMDFQRMLSIRDSEVMKAYSKLKLDGSKELIRDKCLQDIYRRLGNMVLFTVKKIRFEQDKQNYETNNRLRLKRIEKQKRKILLKRCFQLNEIVNQELISAFEEYRNKLTQINYARLREEGYLD